MDEYVSALREFFRAKCGSGSCSDFSSGESTWEIGLPQSEKKSGDENNRSEDSADEPQISPVRNARASGPSHQLSDATDEFFDVINESDCSETDALWSSDEGMQPKVIVLVGEVHRIIFFFLISFRLWKN